MEHGWWPLPGLCMSWSLLELSISLPPRLYFSVCKCIITSSIGVCLSLTVVRFLFPCTCLRSFACGALVAAFRTHCPKMQFSVLSLNLLFCISHALADSSPNPTKPASQSARVSSSGLVHTSTTKPHLLADEKATVTATTETSSGYSTVTEELPASISDIIFPTSIPHWPIVAAYIPGGRPALPQSATNGNGLLGLLHNAPKFPKFIGAQSNQPKTFPWGSRTAQNTNPYQQAPQTGVVRQYNFVIERGVLAPDGVEREVILINGQFPGPTIEANWGDTIEVTVSNQITGPEEGTSLHWHGLLQTGTPYEDGVPGVTQVCGSLPTYEIGANPPPT